MTNGHPLPPDVALYAGGDLPLWQRLRVGWHVRRCESCRRDVEAIRKALAELREASLEPADLDWETLEAEMRANIRLGLTAGALVRKDRTVEETRQDDWRALAVVTAALAVMAIVGWTLHRPGAAAPAGAVDGQVALQPTAEGLSVQWGRQNEAVFGAGRTPVAAAVSWDGSVRAPFVDDETGQVTIYDVAAQ